MAVSDTWDFSEVNEDVDDITRSELCLYLSTSLNFPEEDMRELESKSLPPSLSLCLSLSLSLC